MSPISSSSTYQLTDQEVLAQTISIGRTPAARAISSALDGDWPVSDPFNAQPGTLLIGTFRSLAADARSIFREALCELLKDQGDDEIVLWPPDTLSAALYVAAEVALAGRRPSETRAALQRILDRVRSVGDMDSEGLILKFLADTHLQPNISRWRALHLDSCRRHTYTCFLGIAHIDLTTALIWLEKEGSPETEQLLVDFGFRGLVWRYGPNHVRLAIQSCAADVAPGFFDRISEGYLDALGVPAYARQAAKDSLSSVTASPQIAASHTFAVLAGAELATEADIDEEMKELIRSFDQPTAGPDAYPPIIEQIRSGAYDVAE